MNTKQFGYARVSTKNQNLDELLEQGINGREIYADKQNGAVRILTGRNTKR